MDRDQLRELSKGQLFDDFVAKVGHDIIDTIRRNEDIFFGKTLPTGFACYMALQPLSGVMHAILKGSASIGVINKEELHHIVDLLTESMKEGL